MSRRFPPIPHFVEPYPDESCYSILCRCAVRSVMSTARFCRTMFAKHRFMSYYLWQPFQGEDLMWWFGDSQNGGNTYLLNHSCVPYRYPFLSKMHQSDYEDWFAGGTMYDGVYKRLTRNMGCRFWTKRYLFYCPECVKDDRRNYGETYWHLISQLPGVYVCPIHAIPMEQSALMLSQSWMDLHPAEYWIRDSEPRRDTISYDELRFASDSKWMMENGWKTEVKLAELLEGLTSWQFQQAEAKTSRFTSKPNVKSETAYHILLANMKGKSIADFMEAKEL